MFPNRLRYIPASLAQRQTMTELESDLQNSLRGSQGLDILIQYLDAAVNETDEQFTQLARKAVFDPTVTTAAAQAHGIVKGIRFIRDNMVAIQQSKQKG